MSWLWSERQHIYTGLRGRPPGPTRFPAGVPSDLNIPLNDPADTDAEYAAATMGRNERCPCGSGKKVKKCHGA